MAHNLAETNGRAAMMYVGARPWHGLGTRLEGPARAEEAMEAAGLGYDVHLADVQTASGRPIPQRKAVVRSDTQDVLGVVGNSYVPVQNREAFAFLDCVVADGELRYHTAGALGKGERIWLLAKLPGEIRVKNSDDVSEQYLLLSNSHDGTSALRAFYTPIRVVCQNTLTLAERSARGEGIAIVHKGDLVGKVQQAQRVLGLAKRFYDNLRGQFDALANHYPSRRELEGFFEHLYPTPLEGNPTRAKNVHDELFRLFENGVGQDIPEIRHSTWAALNAVTEYVDHHRGVRVAPNVDRAARRLESAWFGSGAYLKRRAFDAALHLALAV